jgi:hypothetical protein
MNNYQLPITNYQLSMNQFTNLRIDEFLQDKRRSRANQQQATSNKQPATSNQQPATKQVEAEVKGEVEVESEQSSIPEVK